MITLGMYVSLDEFLDRVRSRFGDDLGERTCVEDVGEGIENIERFLFDEFDVEASLRVDMELHEVYSIFFV